MSIYDKLTSLPPNAMRIPRVMYGQFAADTGSTTTGTTGIDSITPEIWATTIDLRAHSFRAARNYVILNRDLMRSGGDILHYPKGPTITAAARSTESEVITATAVTTFSTLDITPAVVQSGVKISSDIIEEVNIDVIKVIQTEMAEAFADKEDDDILALAADATGDIIYGGDATGTDSLETGDTLIVDDVVDALREIRVNDYAKRRSVLFISPYQENELLKSSQFTNAAEFGSNQVVNNGQIGRYLGMDVISTTNTETETTFGASTNITGQSCVVFDPEHAIVLAYARALTMKVWDNPQSWNYEVYMTSKYSQGILQQGSIAVIHVTQA